MKDRKRGPFLWNIVYRFRLRSRYETNGQTDGWTGKASNNGE